MMIGRARYGMNPAKRGRLMETMRQASESDREGVREHLRRDGSKKALAVLEEFEREWSALEGLETAARETTQTGETR